MALSGLMPGARGSHCLELDHQAACQPGQEVVAQADDVDDESDEEATGHGHHNDSQEEKGPRQGLYALQELQDWLQTQQLDEIQGSGEPQDLHFALLPAFQPAVHEAEQAQGAQATEQAGQ